MAKAKLHLYKVLFLHLHHKDSHTKEPILPGVFDAVFPIPFVSIAKQRRPNHFGWQNQIWHSHLAILLATAQVEYSFR